jgi:hypothetical protein
MTVLCGRLYWLIQHKHAFPVTNNNMTNPLVANNYSSSLSCQHLFWHYNTIQHLSISTMPLHWFPSTPLFSHPSVPNISYYTIRDCCEININGTHLLLKVLHICHVPQNCVCYIIYIGSSWLPQFHNWSSGFFTYNLSAAVHFPTRSQGYSSTAIDNIIFDTYKFINFIASSLQNRLSYHDAQLSMIKDVNLQLQIHHVYTIRNINNYWIEEFKTILFYVFWNSIFDCNGIKKVGILFKSFHNNFLSIFCTSLPRRKIIERSNINS